MGWTIISVLPLNITAVSTSTLKAAINSPNLINLINYTGGLTPFTYSISPTLPDPLAIDSTTGYVTGIPTASADTATYTVTLSDSAHQTTATTIRFAVGVGPGEVSYTTPGTYTFTVPEGVTSISVVTVAGGGGGVIASSGYVTQAPTDGGDSTVNRNTTVLVGASGGKHGNNGRSGGAVLVGTGFSGGAGVNSSGRYGGAGGGAGGYTAVGGDGSGTAFDGIGGGGGGVGLYGGTVGGAGGSGGNYGGAGGAGGSGGSNGSGGTGGEYGGGGGGSGAGIGNCSGGGGGALAYSNGIPVTPGESLTVIVGAAGKQELRNYIGYIGGGGPGAKGAVRIIWGDSRSFPSNAS